MINPNPENQNPEKKSNIRQTLIKSFLDEKRVIKSKNQNINSSFKKSDIKKYNFYTKTLQSIINNPIEKYVEKEKEKKIKLNKQEECSFKDISQITKKQTFIINDITDNSLFDDCEEEEFTSQIRYSLPSIVLNENFEEGNNKNISYYYKYKIEHAQLNEEIFLPDTTLTFNSLTITKPIKIKGQIGSCIEINQSSIYIYISNRNEDIDSVKISQVKIILNENDNVNNNEKKSSNLFVLYQGSILNLEDCDIVYQDKGNSILTTSEFQINLNKKSKSIAFGLYTCKKKDENDLTPLISVLSINNTRIANFCQTICSGKNTIVNISKSAISQNSGKAIIILNPLIFKMEETLIDKNSDDAIYIKFINSDLIDEKRQIFLRKNNFEMNWGNAFRLSSSSNIKLKLSVVMEGNIFKYNNSDCVHFSELCLDSLEILKNIFENNRRNGLNLHNLILNGENNIIELKENNFDENYGYGLFVYETIINSQTNKFSCNKAGGIILSNVIDSNKNSEMKSQSNQSGNNLEISSLLNKNNKKTIISKNNFYENGDSGLKIINYSYTVIVEGSLFKENCKHGIFIDLNTQNSSSTNSQTTSSIFSEKLKSFKNADLNQTQLLANLIVLQCVIEKNLKSGISINNSLVYCENSFIIDNMDYAINVNKKEFQYCFKESKIKNKKNTINGNIGGEWGEIEIKDKINCSVGCGSTKNLQKKRKKLIENQVIGSEDKNKNNHDFCNLSDKKDISKKNSDDGCKVI
jgi:hypothetical protein